MTTRLVETPSLFDGRLFRSVTDMTPEMIEMAQQVTVMAMQRFSVQGDIARFIKLEFDRLYNPKWHCIIGFHFWIASDAHVVDNVAPVLRSENVPHKNSSCVTHDSQNFIHLFMSPYHVHLFKSG